MPLSSPAVPAFSLLFCPLSPRPPSRREGGEYYFISPGATAPGTPGIKPFAALTEPAKKVPRAKGSPRFAARMAGNAFLWTESAAKERGDRGRGTSAFEMVLSPGAGRTSAAGVQPPLDFSQSQGKPATKTAKKGGEPQTGFSSGKNRSQESGKITRTAPAFSADADSGQRHFP